MDLCLHIGTKDIEQQFSALSHLPHLTSLVLNGFDLTHAELTQLASTNLVNLQLNVDSIYDDELDVAEDTDEPRILDFADIQLLASLPKLTDLAVWAMAPFFDCSGLPCSWTRLTLRATHDAHQLVKLPLRGVVELRVNSIRVNLNSEGGSSAAATTMSSVVALLAPRWVMDQSGPFSPERPDLILEWDQLPVAPNSYSAQCLEALAPLEHVGFELHLIDWWLGEEECVQLCEALPRLKTLDIKHTCITSKGLAVLATMSSLSSLERLKQ